MRRLIATAVLLGIVAVVALIANTVAQGSDSYQFDVIFDDAHGLISGQEVKIAGAQAGTITNVVVANGDQARVEATISGPFQFHTDATCTIRPDGLIAENYLDCDPGTSGKPLLKASGGEPPTVPVSHTSEPVTLQDLFNIFNLPTRERFQVLIDELGIATAGNGQNINAILQRANPTLQAAQRVIAILDSQTAQIATAIDATDTLAREGADHTTTIDAFIRQAAGLTQETADHSSSLEQAINRLPGLLSATDPALRQLDTVVRTGTPLLRDLRAATPSLNKIDSDIGPFTTLATPALASLSGAVSTITPDAKTITPFITTTANYLSASGPSTANFAKLIVNLIQHGFSENFLSVLYYVSTALGKYDDNSHMLSSLLMFPGNGLCANYVTTPSTNPACNAHYGGVAATPERRGASKRHTTTTTTTTPSGATTTSAAGPPASGTGATTTTGSLSSGLGTLGSTVSSGVSNLLHGVGSAVGSATSGTGPATSGTSTVNSSQTSTGSLGSLLSYLLK